MSESNLKQLRALAVFAVVVESSSFAAAARKLDTSRSRVSETVAGLEDGLGVRLLNRSTRQLTLTSEGKGVYQHAAGLQQVLDDVLAITSDEQLHGRISLTCTHDVGVKKLAPLLAEFEQRHPQISVELHMDDAPVDLIASEIDLAIRGGAGKDSSLVGRSLYEEKMQIFASPEYLRKQGTPECIEDLNQHRWILLTQWSGRKSVELKQEQDTFRVIPAASHLCNAPLMMQAMMCQHMGLGLLPPSIIREETDKGSLVPVLPDYHGDTLSFSLLYPSRKHLPARTRCLVNFLLEHFKQ